MSGPDARSPGHRSPEPAAPALDPLPDDIGVVPGGHVEVPPGAAIPVPGDVAMIGSDLDGTLLSSDLTVGRRSAAALPKLRDAGIEFVYVTGRPPRWLRPVVDQTNHAGVAVCANGALVVDLAEQRLLRSATIDRDLAATVARRLRDLVPGVSFALERLADDAECSRSLDSLTTVGVEPAYAALWARQPEVDSADILTLIDRGRPVKILAAAPADSPHSSDSLLAVAEAEFAGALHITHSGTRTVLIEIMAGSIDKGVGFLDVAAMRGIDPDRTVAVGDMPNDVALIRAAGTGYAVANAHPVARAAADHLLPSNNDDGVGLLLEAILAARR